jgi:hypothetical protein
MSRLLLLSTVFSAFFLSSQAWAGIYIEPYVGYQEGSAKANVTTSAPAVATVSGQANVHGVGYGGKLGFSFLNTAFGVDYMGGGLSSGGNSVSTSDVGIFAQVDIPMFLKFSGSFFILSQETGYLQVNNSAETDKGTGFKVGVGLLTFPLIAINLDYISNTYTKSNPPSGYTYSSFSESSGRAMLSVSIPLDL